MKVEGIEGVKALGDSGDSPSGCAIGEVGYARSRRGCPASGDPRHDPSAKVCKARDIMHSQDSITEHRVAKVFAEHIKYMYFEHTIRFLLIEYIFEYTMLFVYRYCYCLYMLQQFVRQYVPTYVEKW